MKTAQVHGNQENAQTVQQREETATHDALWSGMIADSPRVAAQRRINDLVDNSPRAAAQRRINELVDNSPRVTAQRRQLAAMDARQTAAPVQRQAETIQRVVSDEELETMKTGLATRLGTAIAKAKTGGALALETFINAARAADQIDDGNQANALILLKMTWSLSQVAQYIMDCVAGKGAEDGGQILNALIVVARNTIGTERQPWGAGNHAAYIADPAYFVNMLATPITFLNDSFAGMNDATRLSMVKSGKGWNHQKGTAQLAEDLFSTDYAPPVAVARANVTVTLDQLKAGYMNADFLIPEAIPPVGTAMVDHGGANWTVSAVGVGNCTLAPVG